MKSRVSSGQTQILWKGALSKDSISIGKYGFRGQTEETLEYEVEVKYTDNKNFTYRAEMLIKQGDIWVAYPVSYAYVSLGAASRTIQLTNLPPLPENLEENVIIRVYPWSSQNDLVKYGFFVKEGIEVLPGEELAEALRNAYPDAFTENVLKPGYIVEQNIF